MDYIKINKLTKVSIYKQIAKSISDAIESGYLKYDDRLPTEKELCELFNISQTTVKRAYDKLIKENRIKRIKGKGTYVTNRKVFRAELRKFYEYDFRDIKSDEDYQKEVIMIARIRENFDAYRALKLKSGETVFVVMQVIKDKGNPVLFQKIYLPEKHFKDFEKRIDDDVILFDFIENKYHYKIKNLHSTFSTINSSSAESMVLQISPDDAIYFVRTIVTDKSNRIVAYVCNFYPGEFTEFEVIVNAI